MRQVIKLTESDLHKIIKESVNKILREGWNSNLSPDALDDKAYMNDLWAEREKMMQDDWERRNIAIRKKYPGKSREWYEAMLDTFYENKMNTNKAINEDGATNCASVMQTGCGNAPEGTNPEAGQYTVPFGPDKETSDRTPGFSVKGKAVGKSDVQRRQIYNPKSGK